jgi:hypothetical protein
VGGQRDVALAVALERLRRAVVGVTIDLDDQAPIAPDEVDLDAFDDDVRVGSRLPWSSQRRRKRSSISPRVEAGL